MGASLSAGIRAGSGCVLGADVIEELRGDNGVPWRATHPEVRKI
jgi:hypothetical protein